MSPGSSRPEGQTDLPDHMIGYWRDNNDPATANWPDPRSQVDATWDPKERKRVIRYLKSGAKYAGSFGYSRCRFKCGIPDWKMGKYDLTDGTFVWPEGYAHYLLVHHVKPPERFLHQVRQRLASRPMARVLRFISNLLRCPGKTARSS